MNRFSESIRLEIKQDYSSSFLKTVSAFANYTDGKIIFGIADDGQIVGLEDIDIFKLRIENAINDSIQPRPKFSLSIEKIDGKNIVILTVFKGMQTPYYYQHQAYQRQDTASIPVDAFALQELVLAGTQLNYEELSSSDQDLSFHKLENALRIAIGLENFNMDVLRSLGLYKNGTFNIAAALLADKNTLKQSGVDIARMGHTNSVFMDRKSLASCSLLIQYEESLAYFDQWYKPYEEVVGFYREQRIQIPREAFREALANALVHRDYSKTTAIRIVMYQDRVEITSPGSLPRGISPEEYRRGNVSVPRNEIVAEVFHRLKIIEKFATGIRRIIDEYNPFQEVPLFEIFENSITITLPCVSYNKKQELPDPESMIIREIQNNGAMSRGELQVKTGLRDTKVKELLNKLIKSGQLIRTGQARATKYQLTMR